MSPRDEPSTRNQALVTALQWGLIQTFVLDTLGRFLRNYYRATTDSFVPPSWVTSIQFAAPLALLVGGYGGYRWVTSGRATTTASAHRTRTVFVGALLVGWALAIVPTLVFQWLLGDRLFTVPYFVLPTLTALVALLCAYLLAYRVDSSRYRSRRGRLLGAVQGAVAGLLLGAIGFIAYGSYLAATRANYALNGGPGVVVAACLGAIVGYALTDSEASGERAVEFLTLLVLSTVGATLVSVVGVYALSMAGIAGLGIESAILFPVGSLILPLVIAWYLAYRVRTTVYRRLVGGRRG